MSYMNKLKSILVVLLLCFTQFASAVSLSQTGRGQVLIYPYYTVNNTFNTLMSVINTTDEVKAIKLRFLEGGNGQVVLSQNIYLSPFDVWTAALSASEKGAYLSTIDNSCRIPNLNPIDFDETGFQSDLGSDSEAREREGHFEIFEMGTVIDDELRDFAIHQNGVPQNCAGIRDAWQPSGRWGIDPTDGMGPATGGIYGQAVLVDFLNGAAVGYRAEALSGFYPTDGFMNTSPDADIPSLSSANPTSTVLHEGRAITSTWNQGIDAVSALFMHDRIYGEYVLGSGINALTEMVVNFPTKQFYVTHPTTAQPPFNTPFISPEGACEVARKKFFDREEQTLDFSCSTLCPPVDPRELFNLCYQTTVVDIFNSAAGARHNVPTTLLGSVNSVGLDSNPFNFGYFEMKFENARTLRSVNETTSYAGYPVIALIVQRYTNENAQPGLLAQYATLFQPAYSNTIGTQ